MFEKQIAKGAEWLDANYPGWLNKISLEKLDIASRCNCILGQQFGDYSDFAAKHETDNFTLWSHDHGFTIIDSFLASSFIPLTREWKEYIRLRRLSEDVQSSTTVPALEPETRPAASVSLTSVCLR